jgi:peptidoglycan/xylan/chitin deacetylase (PgdA/CDA1 family)
MTRRVLVEAFALLGFPLETKKTPSLLITHDIETRKGLERAVALKTVEDGLNISSTWFVPSDEYPIPKKIAKELANGSTIGSHDTRHDGKLIHMRRQEELVDRLIQSRAKLETIFEKTVVRFRSPLLQFSRKIAAALSEAHYEFDFSIPCWDPVNPITYAGFGVQFLHPFHIGSITEIPLTLIQDHQLLYVLRMKKDAAIEFLIDQAKIVRAFDGDIVLLVHPDYEFSRDLNSYKKLLQDLLLLQQETTKLIYS